jgi:hypothetical protein
VAAATAILTQTAYGDATATAGSGPVPELAITPPPALIAIPQNGGQFSAGTPFVFFSAYEIISKSAVTVDVPDNDGNNVQCVTATATYAMPSPFSFEYEGADVNGQLEVNADVTGDVNPAFLNIVNVTGAAAGSWVAEPTVVVVMSRIVAVSQSYLATPTPTLLSGFSRYTSSSGQQTVALPATSMDWATALSLQLPDTAYAAQLTSASPPHTTTAQQTTATSQPTSNPSLTSLYTGTPTNALNVLSQALATYDQPSPSNALQVLQWAESTFPASTSPRTTNLSTATTSSSVTSAPTPLATSSDVALADTSTTIRTGIAHKLLPAFTSSLFMMMIGIIPVLI